MAIDVYTTDLESCLGYSARIAWTCAKQLNATRNGIDIVCNAGCSHPAHSAPDFNALLGVRATFDHLMESIQALEGVNRVIAINRIGSGQGESRSEGEPPDRSIWTLANETRSLLDHPDLAIQDYMYIGHSYGGPQGIALGFEQGNASMQGAVLIDPTPLHPGFVNEPAMSRVLSEGGAHLLQRKNEVGNAYPFETFDELPLLDPGIQGLQQRYIRRGTAFPTMPMTVISASRIWPSDWNIDEHDLPANRETLRNDILNLVPESHRTFIPIDGHHYIQDYASDTVVDAVNAILHHREFRHAA